VIARILEWWAVPDCLIELILQFWAAVQLHLRLRPGEDPSAVFNTVAGVLQGDTLSPFIFDLVIDAILRQIPVGSGVLVSNATNAGAVKYQFQRLSNLAFADDIVLMAHTVEDAQRQISALEAAANAVGLYINTAKGKTERMLFGDITPGPLLARDGSEIGIVKSYKYLGVQLGTDPIVDLRAQKRKAWFSVRKFRTVWRSAVDDKVKRRLFEAIAMPQFHYGALTWPTLVQNTEFVHHAATRMLRYALNFPAVHGHHHDGPHTEELWGASLLPASAIRRHRLRQLGHWIREHHSGKRVHPAVQVLSWWPSLALWPRKSGGQLRTVQRAICFDAGFREAETPHLEAQRMYCAATNRDRWRDLLRKRTIDAEREQLRRLRLSRGRAKARARNYGEAPEAKVQRLVDPPTPSPKVAAQPTLGLPFH